MPEFFMIDLDECERTETPFVSGFIQAMFFTEQSCFSSNEWFDPETQESIEQGQSDGNLPDDVGYSNIHPDSLAKIREFCQRKQSEMKLLLDESYKRNGYSEERAGMDLFYTYQGHGVGYWDRDELSDNSGEYERLTSLMVASRDNPTAWNEALRQREALPSDLGERLASACGRGEISPFFGGHSTYGDAPFVHIDMY